MRLVPVYRPRASALNSARAGATAGLCAALALTGALYEHPLVTGAVIVAAYAAGAAAGVRREMNRVALLALPLALLVTLVNPLVYSEGDTLLVRGGEFLGRRWDVTLEALGAGALAGLRVAAVVMALGLLSAVVDPDALLRLFRRVSYRSALSAALAVRLVPVLARDAGRMGEASRCRAQPPERLLVARSALSGALDRAVDVAAALEVRGYASAEPPPRARKPWSRHDLSVASAALALVVGAVAAKVAGVGLVEAYPSFDVPLGPGELALAAGIVLAATAPLAGRPARMGVASRA
jgi:energy-coupling factor transport system permease protein